jgi:hypothetical protein
MPKVSKQFMQRWNSNLKEESKVIVSSLERLKSKAT